MDNCNPMISVLMPVYNVKEYLGYAIDSVLKQTYTNFELILLNDGSTDGSGVIAEEYAKKDERIRVYHIENGGLANARNVLLEKAEGEYVAFVDSDDAIDNDYLELLLKRLLETDSEVAICPLYRYVEEKKMYYFPILDKEFDNKVFDSKEVFEDYLNTKYGLDVAFCTAWTKLIKKELFDDVSFPVGKLHEDSYTIYKIYLKAKKVAWVNKSKYMYRVRENSIMTSGWSINRIRSDIGQHEERIALLALLGIPLPKGTLNDYLSCIRQCKNAALQNGFIDEYKLLNDKCKLIEMYTKDTLL